MAGLKRKATGYGNEETYKQKWRGRIPTDPRSPGTPQKQLYPKLPTWIKPPPTFLGLPTGIRQRIFHHMYEENTVDALDKPIPFWYSMTAEHQK